MTNRRLDRATSRCYRRVMKLSRVVPVLFALASLAFAAPALADGDCDTDHVRVTVVDGHRVYRFDHTCHVTGDPPRTFSLTGRSGTSYSAADAPEHFVQHVVTAVRRAPF